MLFKEFLFTSNLLPLPGGPLPVIITGVITPISRLSRGPPCMRFGCNWVPRLYSGGLPFPCVFRKGDSSQKFRKRYTLPRSLLTNQRFLLNLTILIGDYGIWLVQPSIEILGIQTWDHRNNDLRSICWRIFYHLYPYCKVPMSFYQKMINR